MAKFLTGPELEKAFTEIIWEAKETLLVISPVIKSGDFFKKMFERHLNNQKLHIIIVFGQNDGNVINNMSKEDFEYFGQFLNVSIIHVPNLHAKYFANESKGLITSINLYDYSFQNNIEFGVYFERNTFMDNLKFTTDQEAWEAGLKIANDHEAIFIKRPVYEKKLLFGKNYIKSEILLDYTKRFYTYPPSGDQVDVKKLVDFQSELELGSLSKEPTSANKEPDK